MINSQKDLKNKLSARVHIEDIYEILYYVQGNSLRKKELYAFACHSDTLISYQALWACTHFSITENEWFYDKQNELIDYVLTCTHAGKRRLLLNLLLRQPTANPPRVDFLDFCLEQMMSAKETPGIRSLCMKLAHLQCCSIPELLEEFRSSLEMLEPDLLPASLRAARKNLLKSTTPSKGKE